MLLRAALLPRLLGVKIDATGLAEQLFARSRQFSGR